MKQQLWKMILFTTLVLSALGISGCGGGSSDTTPTPTPTPTPAVTTLSGTAAAGAPVIGSVTIKDSSSPTRKEKTVTILADGKYTVDVSDMTAPFAMRADGNVGGREYHLYSAATQADVGGTVNITPFTDLIVANIAGDIAANFYNNNTYAALTKADLDAAQTALKAKLQPILTAVGLGDSIDLLRTAFSADHQGLDGVLDVLKVTVDPTTKTAEIKNIINNAAISDDLKSRADTSAFTTQDASGVAGGLTDLQGILKGFDDFSALMATSLPRADNAQLLALFDQATFMDDGENLAAFLGDITTDPIIIGLKFAAITVVSLDPVAGAAEVTFVPLLQGQTQGNEIVKWKIVRKNNVWLMQGSQRIAQTEIEVQSQLNTNAGSATPQIQTGFWLNIEDRGARGINTAIVKGPGLPVGGVTLIKNIASNRFGFSIQQPPFNPGNSFVSMDDATVGAIPDTGAIYTFELRDAGNVIMATYTETIRKRPYKLSELTTASFPIITAPSPTALGAFTGGSLTVSWTMPAGLQISFVGAYLRGPQGSAEVNVDPALTATSTTLTILPQTSTGTPITITGRGLNIQGVDNFGRSLSTQQ